VEQVTQEVQQKQLNHLKCDGGESHWEFASKH